MARLRIGDLLIKAGLIDELQLTSALAYQRQWGGKLGDILVDQGFLDEMMLYRGLAKQLDMPLLHLPTCGVQAGAVKALRRDLAAKYEVFPVELDGSTLTVATSSPGDVAAQDELSFQSGKRIRFALAPAREIEWATARWYDGVEADCPPPRKRRELPSFADAAPVQEAGPPPGFSMGFSGEEMPASSRSAAAYSTPPAPAGFAAQPHSHPGFLAGPRGQPGLPSVPPTPAPARSPTQPMAALGAAAAALGQVSTPVDAVAAGRSVDDVEAELRQVTHLLRLVVDACVQRGLFTREEYLGRLRQG